MFPRRATFSSSSPDGDGDSEDHSPGVFFRNNTHILRDTTALPSLVIPAAGGSDDDDVKSPTAATTTTSPVQSSSTNNKNKNNKEGRAVQYKVHLLLSPVQRCVRHEQPREDAALVTAEQADTLVSCLQSMVMNLTVSHNGNDDNGTPRSMRNNKTTMMPFQMRRGVPKKKKQPPSQSQSQRARVTDTPEATNPNDDSSVSGRFGAKILSKKKGTIVSIKRSCRLRCQDS